MLNARAAGFLLRKLTIGLQTSHGIYLHLKYTETYLEGTGNGLSLVIIRAPALVSSIGWDQLSYLFD